MNDGLIDWTENKPLEAALVVVVACSRKTAAAGLAEDLMDYYQDAKKAEELQETYEKEKAASDKALEEAKHTEQRRREEIEASEEWNKDPYSLEKAKKTSRVLWNSSGRSICHSCMCSRTQPRSIPRLP